MRIVVAGAELELKQHSLEVLRARGHAVEVLDPSGVERLVRTDPPEVLLISLPMEIAELRALCAADATRTTYMIAVVPARLPPRALASAVAAGCHDVLHAPFSDEELCARVEVLERLHGWKAASKPAHRAIEASRGWQFLGDIVADDLEAMIGQQVRVKRQASCEAAPVRVATISMVLASDHLELCVALVADRDACRWLGDNLLCEADPTAEMLDDVLREMVNVAGGAVKRAMLPERLVLSTGIPVSTDAVPAGSAGRTWRLVIDEGIALAIVAELRARQSRRVLARGLIEGMVLVDDLCNAAGVLLLPGGTRLTETTAERLRILDLGLVDISSAA